MLVLELSICYRSIDVFFNKNFTNYFSSALHTGVSSNTDMTDLMIAEYKLGKGVALSKQDKTNEAFFEGLFENH